MIKAIMIFFAWAVGVLDVVLAESMLVVVWVIWSCWIFAANLMLYYKDLGASDTNA